jgi:hypothetical protein
VHSLVFYELIIDFILENRCKVLPLPEEPLPFQHLFDSQPRNDQPVLPIFAVNFLKRIVDGAAILEIPVALIGTLIDVNRNEIVPSPEPA